MREGKGSHKKDVTDMRFKVKNRIHKERKGLSGNVEGKGLNGKRRTEGK